MKKVYYFAFSVGEYSDYGVDQICICDHPVGIAEWYAHMAKYREERRNRKWHSDHPKYQTWEDWYNAGMMQKLERWENRNAPAVTFMKLHNMKELDVQYLHRDD